MKTTATTISSIEKDKKNCISISMFVPHFRHSLIFCLLLLLSISSATDSFHHNHHHHYHQQRRRRQQQQQQQQQHVSKIKLLKLPTSTSISSILSSLSPPLSSSSLSTVAISICGGGVSTESCARHSISNNNKKSISDGRRRRRRRKALAPWDNEEYQRRKKEWSDRYATVDGLREKFGTNKNKFFGDLDAQTTRKLYKSLLPTAVCELVLDVDVLPQELAPLAYEARKAAKLYARERCHVPARWFAHWYDGYRQWKKYGRFQMQGMSYDQVYEKYYHQSTLERRSQKAQAQAEAQTKKRRRKLRLRQRDNDNFNDDDSGNDNVDDTIEEEMITQTCMKILLSACRTNPLIDQITLGKRQEEKKDEKKRGWRKRKKGTEKNRVLSLSSDDEIGHESNEDKCSSVKDDEKERRNLERIAQTLEDDVHKLLNPYSVALTNTAS